MKHQGAELYDKALTAWEQKNIQRARRLMGRMQGSAEAETLHSRLLEAYIERDSGRPISAVRVLQHVIERFEGETEPVLVSAWTLLGEVLSGIGENPLAAAAFRQASALEREYPMKLMEYSNALFSLNHQADISAGAMRQYYRGYRALLRPVRRRERWYPPAWRSR